MDPPPSFSWLDATTVPQTGSTTQTRFRVGHMIPGSADWTAYKLFITKEAGDYSGDSERVPSKLGPAHT